MEDRHRGGTEGRQVTFVLTRTDRERVELSRSRPPRHRLSAVDATVPPYLFLVLGRQIVAEVLQGTVKG